MTTAAELINNCINEYEPFDVKILAGPNDHANMDSLPLRFGIHFYDDDIMKVEYISSHYVSYIKHADEHRHVLDCTVVIAGRRFSEVTAVISNNSRPQLITIWRNDTSTEEGLSSLMVRLRELDQINPEILVDLYPSYDSGSLVTKDDLIIALRSRDILYAERDRYVLSKLKEETKLLKAQLHANNEKLSKMFQILNSERLPNSLSPNGSSCTISKLPHKIMLHNFNQLLAG